MVWIITTLVFALIVGVASFAAFRVNEAQKKKSRNLQIVTRNKGLNAAADAQEAAARQRADGIARKLKEAGAENEAKKKDRTTIRELMMHAGIEAPVSRYWFFSALFALVVWGLLSVMTSWSQLAVWLLTFTAFLGMPKFFLKWKAARRQKQFLSEFADALDASVRLLQAGMPISEAIAMASREFTGPLKEEMTKIYESQKIGIPLGTAALEVARRVPLAETHMFATALQIQSETGSSLSEVLSNLSAVIRARFRLKRKVQALSSEAKASAAIIGSLPLLVTFGLYMVREEYISILFTATTGKWLLAGAVFWMSCGVLIMRQMINFRI